MSSLQGCCTLCSILMLLGSGLGVLVDVPQDLLTGTVGQSVLLPVSYRLINDTHLPLPIRWTFSKFPEPFIFCTVQSCSLGAGGAPSQCSADCFTHLTYRGRAKLFPENGSLLLCDLQPSDSGVYTLIFGTADMTCNITLTVHKQHLTPERTDEDAATRIPCYIFGGSYCFILLLLQLLFWLWWWRGMHTPPAQAPGGIRHGVLLSARDREWDVSCSMGQLHSRSDAAS